MERDRLALALELHRGAVGEAAVVAAQQAARRTRDQDDVAGLARGLLDALRGVDRVADHGELDVPAASDRARHDDARVHADADLDLPAVGLAHDGGHLERRLDRPVGVVLQAPGRAEDAQQAVAEELVRVAAVAQQHRDDPAEEVVEPRDDLVRAGPLGEGA